MLGGCNCFRELPVLGIGCCQGAIDQRIVSARHLGGAFRIRDRFGAVAQGRIWRSRENPRQIICRIAIIRIEGEHLLPLFDGLGRAPDPGQGGAKIITRVQIIRLKFKTLLPMLDRFIGFALLRQSKP